MIISQFTGTAVFSRWLAGSSFLAHHLRLVVLPLLPLRPSPALFCSLYFYLQKTKSALCLLCGARARQQKMETLNVVRTDKLPSLFIAPFFAAADAATFLGRPVFLLLPW